MCLAVSGKITSIENQNAEVDVQGNKVNVSIILVPEVVVDDYVLVHAGFAITKITQADHIEQERILKEVEEYALQSLEE